MIFVSSNHLEIEEAGIFITWSDFVPADQAQFRLIQICEAMEYMYVQI